jgi:hypothetical protein
MSVLKSIIEEYRNHINPDFHSLGIKKLIFKQLLGLHNLYPEEICEEIKDLLIKIYKLLKMNHQNTLMGRDGILAGAIYLSSQRTYKKFNQVSLASKFNITEVTLRSRTKELKKLDFLDEILEELANIVQKAKNITLNGEIEEIA